MNRRGFLSDILKLGVASMVLPSALTYQRKWVKTGSLVVPQFDFWEYIAINYSILRERQMRPSRDVDFWFGSKAEADLFLAKHRKNLLKYYENH